MATSSRPQWREQDAVADWVLTKRCAALLHAMGFKKGPYDEYVARNPFFITSEQEAVDAAKRGKPSKLADLFETHASDLEKCADQKLDMSPATLRMVAEFLSGRRNLKTGRAKGEQQRGRPKMDRLERAEATPTHDAASYFVAVKKVLRKEYPNQSAADYPRKRPNSRHLDMSA